MEPIFDKYNEWNNNIPNDSPIKQELKAINGIEKEIYDRFYCDLTFGTAGLRGILGAGTNRMNIYTVRKATMGLAIYLNKRYLKPSVAISFDSRTNSELFARESARVLAANNIKVYITKELEPTPVLSFLVRELSCQAGIMITASHNPAEYNGYKCYGNDGCQMTEETANKVYDNIQKLDTFKDVSVANFDDSLKSGIIKFIDDTIYEKYLEKVQSQSINPGICSDTNLKVVYTPLNGAGNKLVREILKRTGVSQLSIVKEQEMPDGNFTTCPYPNPEIKEALLLALELANKEQPHIVLATDPDSDRVGVAIKENGEYRLLTGNEIGILLCNYILSQRKAKNLLPQKPIIIKTIVSTELAEKIAKDYGCSVINVLTGFKYIGEQILRLEEKGEENRFIFGFEESYGYLSGTYVRDKDAVVASMLICEMAAFYMKKNMSLADVLNSLYDKYGYYKNTTLNYGFSGSEGIRKMQSIMENLRNEPPKSIAGLKVVKIADYEKSIVQNLENHEEQKSGLPKSNVLSFFLENENCVIIRPSGTEPKIKAYITAVGTSLEDAFEITQKLKNKIDSILKS